VVHALPVLRHLRRAYPQAEIHWWINVELASLIEGDPDLDRVIHFHRKRWANPVRWHELIASAAFMRRMHYDLVIDLQGLLRSAACAWLAGGELTVGLEDWRELAPAFYDQRIPRGSAGTHAVDWYLEVVRSMGLSTSEPFEWMPVKPAAAASVRQRWPLEGKRRVLFQPGARWDNKRWPVAHFQKLGGLLAARFPDLHFGVIGGPDEAGLAESIVRTLPAGRAENFAGKTSLGEIAELIRGAAVLVTNDTGPMHIAVAVKTPLVALFGPTDPLRTGPYRQLGQVLQSTGLACVPCMKSTCRHQPWLECLNNLPPETVCTKVAGILA
jgi:lipopolysaccharide heptosyltransferase II